MINEAKRFQKLAGINEIRVNPPGRLAIGRKYLIDTRSPDDDNEGNFWIEGEYTEKEEENGTTFHHFMTKWGDYELLDSEIEDKVKSFK